MGDGHDKYLMLSGRPLLLRLVMSACPGSCSHRPFSPSSPIFLISCCFPPRDWRAVRAGWQAGSPIGLRSSYPYPSSGLSVSVSVLYRRS
jgi:hypothetical protein